MSYGRFRLTDSSSSASFSSPSITSPIASGYFDAWKPLLAQANPNKRPANNENEPPSGLSSTPTPASKKQKTTHPRQLSTVPLQCLAPAPVYSEASATFREAAPPSQLSRPASLAHQILGPSASGKLTERQKGDCMLKVLSELNWTVSEFMHHLFLDSDGLSMSHAQTVSKFLKGETKYTPASIIKLWDTHSSGRLLHERDRIS